MKQIIYFCIITLSMGLKMNYVDSEFTIGVISFPKGTMQGSAFSRVDSTASIWQTRQEEFYDITLSETSGAVTPTDPFKTSGYPFTKVFLGELVKDLAPETIQKLRSCRINARAVGHVDAAIKKEKQMQKTPGLWIILAPETVKGEELAKHAPNNAILIGNGYNSEEFDKFNVDGKKIHNLWLPYALWWYAESNVYTPMELMTRNRAKAAMSEKSDKLSVVYQQFKCYPEREQWWDDLCEGMHAIGQQCYATSKCNGDKHLGIPAPFRSAGGRSAANWQDSAITNYAKFKFVSALEHVRNSFGYVSEKLWLPLIAGSIPIYTGDQHALELLGINPKSYVYVTPDVHREVIEEVQNLLRNETEYKERIMQPIMSEEKFAEYFTWHSSTWERYGDRTRQKVINAILDVCNSS